METNLLPFDGLVQLDQDLLAKAEADHYYDLFLNNIHWKQKPIVIFGKTIQQPRLIAWHGDESCQYTYSSLQLSPKPWTPELWQLKFSLETLLKCDFNSVLLNLYRNQSDSIGWHSDNELELGNEPIIASISLGAERDFLLKHCEYKQEKIKLNLKHGSLLVMRGQTQKKWLHCLPKRSAEMQPRINLTFRRIFS